MNRFNQLPTGPYAPGQGRPIGPPGRGDALPPFATHGTISGPSIPPIRGGGFQQPAPMSQGGDPMGQVEFGPSAVAPIFNPPAATGGVEPAPGYAQTGGHMPAPGFNPQTGGGFQMHPGYGGMGMGGGPRPFGPPNLFGVGNPFMGLFGGGFNPFMGGGFNPFFGGGFQASPYRRRGMFSNFMGGM